MALVLAILCAAPQLELARELDAGLRFRAVVEVLGPVIADPALDLAERREAVDLYARALAALGRLDEAEEAWVRLLELDPGASAPAGAAPKLQALFARARARVPLPAEPPAPPPPVEPEPPPPQLLPQRPPPAVAQLELPAAEPAPPRWVAWALAASAAVSLGVGVALAASASADLRAAHGARFASDARALDERALRNAAAANVLLLGALAGGATSGVLLWRWR